MPVHELKKCERCNAAFECKPGNVTQCQCFGVEISDGARQYLTEHYADCLCRSCLVELSAGLAKKQ